MTGADVRSLDALREWQSALAQYTDEAGEAIQGVRLEIQRGLGWVAEQLSLWQHSIRKCEDEVVQAKAELAARRFPDVNGRMPDTIVQERNLRRAQAKLDHAREQVVVCRRWMTELPKVVDETFNGSANRLANLLDGDVARGLAVLTRQITAIEEYAGLRVDHHPGPAASSVPSSPPPAATAGDAS